MYPNTYTQVVPVMANQSLLKDFQLRSSAHNISLQITKAGFTLTRSGSLVAWVVCGHHNGQHEHKPLTCRFVDVAYYRTTQKGVNLETADFLDLESALHFLADTFGLGGAA